MVYFVLAMIPRLLNATLLAALLVSLFHSNYYSQWGGQDQRRERMLSVGTGLAHPLFFFQMAIGASGPISQVALLLVVVAHGSEPEFAILHHQRTKAASVRDWTLKKPLATTIPVLLVSCWRSPGVSFALWALVLQVLKTGTPSLTPTNHTILVSFFSWQLDLMDRME